MRFFIQFGGQGNSYLSEMKRLYRRHPELDTFFTTCFAALDRVWEFPDVNESPYLQHGIALKNWLEDEEQVPPEAYLNSCTISLPCTEITQLAYFQLLLLRAYDQDELIRHTAGMTGHSQGVLAAVFAALNLSGEEYWNGLQKHIQFLFMGGLRCQELYGIPALPDELIHQSMKIDGSIPGPMMALHGYSLAELTRHIDEYIRYHSNGKSFAPAISLINNPQSMVISGAAEDMMGLRLFLKDDMEKNNVTFNYLEITAPFHYEMMAPSLEKFRQDLKRIDYQYQGQDLKVPVYSTNNGKPLNNCDALGEELYLLQSSQLMNWPLSLDAMLKSQDITHVIDCGPGRISVRLTQNLLHGSSKTVLSLVGKEGWRKLPGQTRIEA